MHFIGVATFAIAGAVAATVAAQVVEPLPNAHAHNDYRHERPLFDALDRGFASVEVDIFAVDGELLVGHDREELTSDRTLESLYLEPLAGRVRQNEGRVYENGERFFLLIDIKSNASETYPHLHKVLSSYAPMLTVVDGGKIRQGAVTVVISGNRPTAELKNEAPRYAGIDGRLSDLDSDAPAHLMPMISDQWTAHFSWNGKAAMPAKQRAKLREIVDRVHKSGRVVRFWATPENESVWRELRSAGVNLIGTDQLDRLAAFLRSENPAVDE